MKYNIIDTKIAQIHLLTEGHHLCALLFNSERHKTILQNLNYNLEEAQSSFILNIVDQLNDYYAGKLKKFDIPYKFTEGTEFQNEVWKSLENIPYGTTKTYKQIAESIGKPNAIRAIANSIGQNPISIIVPCHRVIGSDGKLHGYAGGVEIKSRLLRLEKGKVHL